MEAKGRPQHVLRRLWQQEDAHAASEYALMLAVIVVAALAGATLLGQGVRDVFINEAWELPSGAAAQ